VFAYLVRVTRGGVAHQIGKHSHMANLHLL